MRILEQQIVASASTSHLEALQQALDEGGPVDNCDEDGHTPLWHSAHRGHTAGAEALCSAKANVNLETERGETALLTAAAHGGDSCNAVMEVLVRHKAEVNYANRFGLTPLLAASSLHNTQVVAALVRHGAQVNLSTAPWGTTPLIAAAGRPIAWLLEQGGSWAPGRNGAISVLTQANALPDYENTFGKTALHVAAESANPLGVAALLVAKADPNRKSSLSEQTPLEVALGSRVEMAFRGEGAWTAAAVMVEAREVEAAFASAARRADQLREDLSLAEESYLQEHGRWRETEGGVDAQRAEALGAEGESGKEARQVGQARAKAQIISAREKLDAATANSDENGIVRWKHEIEVLNLQLMKETLEAKQSQARYAQEQMAAKESELKAA